MQRLKFRFKLGILPLQNPYPLIPGFEVAIKAINDPQVFLVDIGSPPVLLQDPRRG